MDSEIEVFLKTLNKQIDQEEKEIFSNYVATIKNRGKVIKKQINETKKTISQYFEKENDFSTNFSKITTNMSKKSSNSAKLKKLKNQLNNEKNQKSEMHKDYEKLSIEYKELEETYNRLKISSDEEKQELGRLINQKTEIIYAKDEIIAKLKDRNKLIGEENTNEIEELKKQINEEKEINSKILGEIKEKQKRRVEEQDLLFKEQIKHKDAQIKTLEMEIKRLTDIIDLKDKLIEQQKREIVETFQKNRYLGDLSNVIPSIPEEKNEEEIAKEKEREEREKEIKREKEANMEERKRLNELFKEIKQLSNTLNESHNIKTDEFVEITRDRERYKMMYIEANQKMQNAIANKRTVEETLISLKQEVAEKDHLIKKLANDVSLSQMETKNTLVDKRIISILQSKLKQSQEFLVNLNNENSKLKLDKESAKKIIAKQMDQLDLYSIQINEQDETLEQMKMLFESKSLESSNLKKKLKYIEKYRNEISSLKEIKTNLELDNQNLKTIIQRQTELIKKITQQNGTSNRKKKRRSFLE